MEIIINDRLSPMGCDVIGSQTLSVSGEINMIMNNESECILGENFTTTKQMVTRARIA